VTILNYRLQILDYRLKLYAVGDLLNGIEMFRSEKKRDCLERNFVTAGFIPACSRQACVLFYYVRNYKSCGYKFSYTFLCFAAIKLADTNSRN